MSTVIKQKLWTRSAIVLMIPLTVTPNTAGRQSTSAASIAQIDKALVEPGQQEIQRTNDRFVRQIAERIAGRETEPAENVFNNIQWLKGVRAQLLLTIMNEGYSRALGVACTHCHVESDFSSDDKRPKRAAREMAAMHRLINQQLRGMKELEAPADKRAINCSTCHRGAVNPMAPPGRE